MVTELSACSRLLLLSLIGVSSEIIATHYLIARLGAQDYLLLYLKYWALPPQHLQLNSLLLAAWPAPA